MTLLPLLKLSVKNPRAGMRAVLNLPLIHGEALGALVLVSILSSLLLHGLELISPTPEGSGHVMMFFGSPFSSAALQFGFLLAMAGAARWLGGIKGGRGSLRDMILVVAWLEALMLALQLVQIAIMIILPGIGSIMLAVTLGTFFWFLTNFIAEAHGFRSLGRVLVSIILAMIACSFALSFLLAIVLGPEVLVNV